MYQLLKKYVLLLGLLSNYYLDSDSQLFNFQIGFK